VPLVPVTLEGSWRVITPKTLRVNPGVIIRIKIDRPVDVTSYQRSEKLRLMGDVFVTMSANLSDLRLRHRSGEELEDIVCRWIRGKRGPSSDAESGAASAPES